MNEAEIILTAQRHKELVRAETQLDMVKDFLGKRLNDWQSIAYTDLKTVCDLLGIERREAV